ncbi:hypothetical protein DPSP01_009734 [Paraphaeosphaeria sporulosa]|uniref:IDI-2 n=1 Tax=Paraphaeosphaeria sporulosa TaxID=1460663 RepID=A0A177CCR6_9PLEO|nr:uncharacterized protein CC84DRAFT_810715 [Paraphaeosphaeria sporulosa]OAG04971.1 hypothetical protein CC84DRAFT_810715 [Paraphaeosphaeria sporulosa]
MKLSTTLLILLDVLAVSAVSVQAPDANEAPALHARSELHKRGCAWRQYGCEKGYCWQKCEQSSPGGWCWLAFNGGNGDWVTCSKDSDCVDRHDNNPSCGNPTRPSGGCSC